MGTGYSLFTETLIIGGSITLTPEEEIQVQPQGTDENGVDRFTSNANVTNLFGNELLRVINETAEGNSITTTMKVQSTFSFFGSTLQIQLQITNGSDVTFRNGRIEVVTAETTDTNRAFTNRNQTVNPTTLEPGQTATVTVRGSINVRNIANGTQYKYKITYDTNEGEKVFYYTLIFEP